MEKNVVFAAVLTLLLFTAEAQLEFAGCYAGCYAECILFMKKGIPGKKLLNCAWKCTKDCLFHGAALDDDDYCKLNCIINSCMDHLDDPKRMAGCLKKCGSHTCKNKP